MAIKALEIDNDYRPAYSELGHAYNQSKKYSEAIEQFKKNMTISSVDLPVLYSGLCYIELGQKENAMKMSFSNLEFDKKKSAGQKTKNRFDFESFSWADFGIKNSKMFSNNSKMVLCQQPCK